MEKEKTQKAEEQDQYLKILARQDELIKNWYQEFGVELVDADLKKIAYRMADLENDYASILATNEYIANQYEFFTRHLPTPAEMEVLIECAARMINKGKLYMQPGEFEARQKILTKMKSIIEKLVENPKVPNVDEHMKAANINTKEYWDKVYKNEIDNENIWRLYPETASKIWSIMNGSPKQSVTEFGSGLGVLANELARYCESWFGYDLSVEAARYAYDNRKFKHTDFRQLDLLSEDSDEFIRVSDIVIATEFLEHFKDHELDIILKRATMSAPNAIFVVPNEAVNTIGIEEHYQSFTKESFTKLLGRWYKSVTVEEFVDQFDTPNGQPIQIPLLIATCEGVKYD